jgi:branched-chain amino acid transport system permease protein
VLVLAGLIAAAVGMLFGIPSLRIKGLYLAVATLAAQFFMDWLFARVKWFTELFVIGIVSTAPIDLFGWTVDTPAEKYLFLLGVLSVFTLVAKEPGAQPHRPRMDGDARHGCRRRGDRHPPGVRQADRLSR